MRLMEQNYLQPQTGKLRLHEDVELPIDGLPQLVQQYINEDAPLYKGVEEEPKRIVRPFRPRYGFADDTDERVYMACLEIKGRHIDMTENYHDWINLVFSLASLGEEGREYFHIVSSQNAKYTERETDRKFDGFLRGNGRIGIGAFFHYCKQYGVL